MPAFRQRRLSAHVCFGENTDIPKIMDAPTRRSNGRYCYRGSTRAEYCRSRTAGSAFNARPLRPVLGHRGGGAELDEPLENCSHSLGVLHDDDEFAILAE